ncbi:MAG: DNA polymerase III subunit delta' [Nitrospirae bacterium]|nr:DNA polymerase III subunit delta' [Nitrospirota bacterium]
MSLVNHVVGHNRQKAILLKALERGREATSYLFSGESGVGKGLFALEYAKAVNCLTPKRVEGLLDACDQCSSCRKVSSGNHPDLMVVEPEGDQIKIDQIREITEFLSFSPYEGNKKVVIVRDAERMNQAASNAFLKTLEEPPDKSLIILVTASEESLLETIRSRCFRIKFAPLSKTDTRRVLDGLEEAPKKIPPLFIGRPGLIAGDDRLSVKELFNTVTNDIKKGTISKRWADRAEADLWLSCLLVLLRDLVVLSETSDPTACIGFEGRQAKSLAGKTGSLDFIIDLYQRVNELRKALVFNLNLSLLSNYINTCLEELHGKYSS